MDASVTFGDVARTSHSVVLASGTLHPMDALLSELGSDFNRRLRRVSNNSDAPVRVVFEHSLSQ
jgi:Rad3-related DNA helicase